MITTIYFDKEVDSTISIERWWAHTAEARCQSWRKASHKSATPAVTLPAEEHLQFYYTEDRNNTKFTYKAIHKALGSLTSLAAA